MSVNGVTANVYASDTYQAYASKTENKSETKTDGKVYKHDKVNKHESDRSASASAASDKGVVYEQSAASTTTEKSGVKNSKVDPAFVEKLKAEVEQRTAQFRSLVEQIIAKQGVTIGTASDDMWKFLAGGNFTVDAATKAQAQADIAEDGYWGVEQTSSRIFDFAKALSGGDADKMEKMRAAFQKGFDQATSTWGKKLPDISQKTYDAVMKKFDDYAESLKTPETEETTA